jgi:hypothetical protein
MSRIKVITLTPEQQTALEHGLHTGQSAAFRKRGFSQALPDHSA